MYKIALTGGIGTGKTHLSKQFVEMGIPVFCADEEAKKLYREPDFMAILTDAFGCEIMTPNHCIDLVKLSQIIFSDENKLLKINRLIHPQVMKMFEDWSEKQTSYAVMMESALVFEGGLEHYFDKIIVADSPLELRIKRIVLRNPNWSREDILQRISRQLPQDEKCRRADLIVCTGETYCESNH